MSNFYIYKLRFLNGETYIGSHVQHKAADSYVTSSSFYFEHKDELISREVVLEVKDRFTMNLMETICIMQDKRDNPKNVNGNLGNYFHRFPNDGSSRRGKHASDETRKKLSESHKGKTPWNKGKKLPPMPEETRRKISNTTKGKVFSEETRRKISEAQKGKKEKPRTEAYRNLQRIKALDNWEKLSEEDKKLRAEKISKATKGKAKKPHSEDWKKKVSEKLKGKVVSEETRRKLSEKAKEREAKKKLAKQLALTAAGGIVNLPNKVQ